MFEAALVFLVCAVGTIAGYEIREALPPFSDDQATRLAYLWNGFGMAALIDAATIPIIRWHNIRLLTNPLTTILALAIIAHTLGAFLFVSGHYGLIGAYDLVIDVLTLAQIAVFGWWWGSRNGRRDRRACRRTPSLNLNGRPFALRDTPHKAHHR